MIYLLNNALHIYNTFENEDPFDDTFDMDDTDTSILSNPLVKLGILVSIVCG